MLIPCLLQESVTAAIGSEYRAPSLYGLSVHYAALDVDFALTSQALAEPQTHFNGPATAEEFHREYGIAFTYKQRNSRFLYGTLVRIRTLFVRVSGYIVQAVLALTLYLVMIIRLSSIARWMAQRRAGRLAGLGLYLGTPTVSVLAAPQDRTAKEAAVSARLTELMAQLQSGPASNDRQTVIELGKIIETVDDFFSTPSEFAPLQKPLTSELYERLLVLLHDQESTIALTGARLLALASPTDDEIAKNVLRNILLADDRIVGSATSLSEFFEFSISIGSAEQEFLRQPIGIRTAMDLLAEAQAHLPANGFIPGEYRFLPKLISLVSWRPGKQEFMSATLAMFWEDLKSLPPEVLQSFQAKAWAEKWERFDVNKNIGALNEALIPFNIQVVVSFNSPSIPSNIGKLPRATVLHLDPVAETVSFKDRTYRIHEVLGISGYQFNPDEYPEGPIFATTLSDMVWFAQPIEAFSSAIARFMQVRVPTDGPKTKRQQDEFKKHALENMGSQMSLDEPFAYDILHETFDQLSPDQLFNFIRMSFIRQQLFRYQWLATSSRGQPMEAIDYQDRAFMVASGLDGDLVSSSYPYFQLLTMLNHLRSVDRDQKKPEKAHLAYRTGLLGVINRGLHAVHLPQLSRTIPWWKYNRYDAARLSTYEWVQSMLENKHLVGHAKINRFGLGTNSRDLSPLLKSYRDSGITNTQLHDVLQKSYSDKRPLPTIEWSLAKSGPSERSDIPQAELTTKDTGTNRSLIGFWNDLSGLPADILAPLKSKALAEHWTWRTFMNQKFLDDLNRELLPNNIWLQITASGGNVFAACVHLNSDVKTGQIDGKMVRFHEVERVTGELALFGIEGYTSRANPEDMLWYGRSMKQLRDYILAMRSFREDIAAAATPMDQNDRKLAALQIFGPSMMQNPMAYDILNEAFGDIPDDELYDVIRKVVLEHEAIHSAQFSGSQRASISDAETEMAAYLGNVLFAAHPYEALLFLATTVKTGELIARDNHSVSQHDSSVDQGISKVFSSLVQELKIDKSDFASKMPNRLVSANQLFDAILVMRSNGITEAQLHQAARAVFIRENHSIPEIILPAFPKTTAKNVIQDTLKPSDPEATVKLQSSPAARDIYLRHGIMIFAPSDDETLRIGAFLDDLWPELSRHLHYISIHSSQPGEAFKDGDPIWERAVELLRERVRARP